MPRRARAAIAEPIGETGVELRADGTPPAIAELQARIAGLSAELRASEERHSLIVQAVAEGIYEWDIEHNALWPSPRLIEIFGFHDRALTAADWNELVHPEDFPRYRAALRDCLRGLSSRLDCEYRL